VGIQISEWPSRLHAWVEDRSFTVTGLDRAGGGSLQLPTLHRCASRASRPAPHPQKNERQPSSDQ